MGQNGSRTHLALTSGLCPRGCPFAGRVTAHGPADPASVGTPTGCWSQPQRGYSGYVLALTVADRAIVNSVGTGLNVSVPIFLCLE